MAATIKDAIGEVRAALGLLDDLRERLQLLERNLIAQDPPGLASRPAQIMRELGYSEADVKTAHALQGVPYSPPPRPAARPVEAEPTTPVTYMGAVDDDSPF